MTKNKCLRDDNFEEEINEDANGDDYSEDIDDGDEIDSLIIEDDDIVDIIIEVDDNDDDIVDTLINNIGVEALEEDIKDDVVLSKHTMEGKHSLKYDSIFKGKKESSAEEAEYETQSSWSKDTIEIDKSSAYYQESMDAESYSTGKHIKERVYEVLKDNTNLNFLNNRRKPSRVDFNNYYELLKVNLKSDGFTNVQLFNELSVYFSDNLFNMFKLLDNKWRIDIIQELQEHIGKNSNSKEITNRNIYEGTEIEFLWFNELDKKEKLITGVVLETDYSNSTYMVDSYENIYQVELLKITKILNNTKFKYNLNKINNIDFL
jgi:hypothetical protein